MYKKISDTFDGQRILEKDILQLRNLKESRTEKNKNEVDDQIDELREKILDSDELSKFIYEGVTRKIEFMIANLEQIRAISRDKKDKDSILDDLISNEVDKWDEVIDDYIGVKTKEIL